MKRILTSAVTIALVAIVVIVVNRKKQSDAQSAIDSASEKQIRELSPDEVAALPKQELRAAEPTQSQVEAENPKVSRLPVKDEFTRSLDILTYPQSTFAEKQAVWAQLRTSERLDDAITELEKRTKENPESAEYPSVLGQAYINKIATAQDTRERAILGMKADQSFDAALKLDPSNWDARFFKATALTHWPAELNKTSEAIEHFNELIKQQESGSPQPQYAQTYLRLGQQYQKAGQSDYAKHVWQRGAALFPSDPALKKLATQ